MGGRTHCLGIQAEEDPCREDVGRGEHRGDPLHLVAEGYQHQEEEGRVVALKKISLIVEPRTEERWAHQILEARRNQEAVQTQVRSA